MLRFFLDEGVPDSVGRVLVQAGHMVIRHRDALAPGMVDEVVAATALANDAILVALDADMRTIARGYGIGQSRFRTLSLLHLSCSEPRASRRVEEALSLIEHEWLRGSEAGRRRLFIEVGNDVIRVWR